MALLKLVGIEQKKVQEMETEKWAQKSDHSLVVTAVTSCHPLTNMPNPKRLKASQGS